MGTVYKVSTLHLNKNHRQFGVLEIGNFYTDVCLNYALPGGLLPLVAELSL